MQADNIYYRTQGYTIKDYYRAYNEMVITEGYVPVSYKDFRSVLEDFFKTLSELIIEQGKTVTLPSRMGKLSVRKYLGHPDYVMLDYQSTKEEGVPVWQFNDHTGGYRYKFYWDKKPMMTTNSTKYQLIMTRCNKRRLAKVIKNKEMDYIGL